MMMMMMMMIVIVDKKQLLGCTRNNSLTIVDLPSGSVKASLRQVNFSDVMDIEFPLPLRWLAASKAALLPQCYTVFLMVFLTLFTENCLTCPGNSHTAVCIQ